MAKLRTLSVGIPYLAFILVFFHLGNLSRPNNILVQHVTPRGCVVREPTAGSGNGQRHLIEVDSTTPIMGEGSLPQAHPNPPIGPCPTVRG